MSAMARESESTGGARRECLGLRLGHQEMVLHDEIALRRAVATERAPSCIMKRHFTPRSPHRRNFERSLSLVSIHSHAYSRPSLQ